MYIHVSATAQLAVLLKDIVEHTVHVYAPTYTLYVQNHVYHHSKSYIHVHIPISTVAFKVRKNLFDVIEKRRYVEKVL